MCFSYKIGNCVCFNTDWKEELIDWFKVAEGKWTGHRIALFSFYNLPSDNRTKSVLCLHINFRSLFCIYMYRNVPKFLDRHAWANSADPGAVWSGSTLFAIPSASFGYIILKEKPSCSTFRVITANVWVSEILGVLWHVLLVFGMKKKDWWSWLLTHAFMRLTVNLQL